MNEQSTKTGSSFLKHSNHSTGHDEENIDLTELLPLFKTHRFFILGLVLLGILIAIIYAARIPQQYESNALIQVENSSNEMQGVLQSLSISGSATSSQAMSSIVESSLLKSRFILQPTVESLGLNVRAEPQYFPILGTIFARHHKGSTVAAPILGLNNYAWGGEKIVVQKFVVPANFWDRSFKIVAAKKGTYKLYDSNDNLILTGIVGRTTKATTNSIIPELTILVSDLKANEGMIFNVQISSAINTANQISNNIKIDDLGGRQQNNTGVLQVSLKGTNAGLIPTILNTIVYYEIQKNISKKTAETQKTLDFLNQQSDLLKNELNKAESRLSAYKVKSGALGVTVTGQALLGQMIDISKSIEALKLKRAELLQDFTEQHPYIITLNKEQEKLQQQLARLEKKASTLPKAEQETIGLEREVRVKDQLYLLMLSKIQQLQIAEAGTISDVRILANATPATPLPSSTYLIIFCGGLLGLIAALGIVLLRFFIYHGIEDPDYLEERLGIPLYAIIPYSKKQKQLLRNAKNNEPSKQTPNVLATLESKDPAIEGLRSLRTILQLNLQEAQNNIIAILGTSPSVGKSFISLNLAYVLADSGKKVLLVDVDLRRGKIHQHLGQPSSPGLAELLAHKSTFKSVKRTLRDGLLDFIAPGKYPENPSELLFSKEFKMFLDEVSPQYDIVILDTPPILLVSDGIIIAKQAGLHLLLLGSGSGSLKEIEHAKKRLQKNNVHVDGLIFNNAKESGGYGHGYGKYGYYTDVN